MIKHVLSVEAQRVGTHTDRTIDGQVGARAGDPTLPSTAPDWWVEYVRRLRAPAEQF